MVKPINIFLIALAHSVGFLFLNVYPIIRLHADPGWGSNGSGFTSSYGFPLSVGSSVGCFTGPGYSYGNLALNLIAWNCVAAALMALPAVTSWTRALRKTVTTSISNAFNYGGLIADELVNKS